MTIMGIERLKQLKVQKLKENNKTCVQCKNYKCFDRKEFPCIDCMLDCKDRFEPKGDKE